MSFYFENGFERAFGTYPLRGNELHNAILAATDVGYRAFDTAQMYGNEHETGAALRESGLGSGQVCITTKVSPQNFGEDRFLDSVKKSLDDLQVGSVAVLLLHWPPADGQIERPLRLLQQAYEHGFASAIGVSNFTARMMRDAKDIVDVPLVTNQVEFHPLLNQDILLKTAAETGIALSSYCSVARGAIFEHDVLADIAASYGRSVAQITLRWILQKGVSVNASSSRSANIRDNFGIMDFTLSSVDLARIDALTRTNYRIVDKTMVPTAPDFD